MHMHPHYQDVLIYERDFCLMHGLRQAKGPHVVGIVGLAHIFGILELWDNYEPEEDCDVGPFIKDFVHKLYFTEGEGFEEFDKIRAKYQIPRPVKRPFPY